MKTDADRTPLHRRLARRAKLRYVTDAEPGIRRARRGRGFVYFNASKRRIRRRAELGRIEALRIPPAWSDVWICSSATGHLQATGRDARGRKQFRYHERWDKIRDQDKFERMLDFARELPRIRRRVTKDLQHTRLQRETVLASVVRLLDKTAARVGNEEYARENGSYGLTTLRNRHVQVQGKRIELSFPGKSGKQQEIEYCDRRLAQVVKRTRELPGREVFQYVDEQGEVRDVRSQDVNDYLREITGSNFTAKDFRTWCATVLAAEVLAASDDGVSPSARKRQVVAAIDRVASELGNTRAVCRKSYIHPAIIQAYLDERLADSCRRRSRSSTGPRGLRADEHAVLRMLKKSRC